MRSSKWLIRAFIPVVILLAVVEWMSPPPANWTPSFRAKDKIPYGLFVFKNELPAFYPESRTVDTTLVPDSLSGPSTLIMIKDKFDFGKEVPEAEELLRLAAQGHSVFISTRIFPYGLLDSLGVKTEFESLSPFEEYESVTWFENPRVRDTFRYGKMLPPLYFTAFPAARTLVLARERADSGKVGINFIKIRHGKGAFYLHTRPYYFTNYHMLKDRHGRYAAVVAAYTRNPTVIWKLSPLEVHTSTHPLRYILQDPALAWAWKVLYWGLLLFLLLAVKRTQRPIPVIRPPENKSVEFARTVAAIYKREGTPADIIRLMREQFLEELREATGLKGNPADREFRKKVAAKTGMPPAKVARLFDLLIRMPYRKYISQKDLLQLDKEIRAFKNQAYGFGKKSTTP
ncbi:MAG: hypothetical protein GXO27_06365 [Chlorobi bacterium]|nr:hypothetical protein [Chlorobiota bacterium]